MVENTVATQQSHPEKAEEQLVPPQQEEIEQMKQVLLFLDNKNSRG